ncbi:DUF5302 domain-containing protein [Leucobacter coleopterorum]|uniref:DUF5302 domain-containing protein n=1 Tax=Leucobacter coleopterorum TaxID=2714933 RepID=A0ABX6JVU7_9MICO|nr:DUF5302 domain-containing protein [Leucobacter coleopterorum]QIM18431.1 DUF5302 domain-containing protein [Leucobacter coleopterorum]
MSSEEDAQREAAEESKRKFREALDRKKKQQTQPRGAGKRGDAGPVGHAQGSAAHQREFRRKSG